MRYIRVGNALHKSAVLSGVLALGMSFKFSPILIIFRNNICNLHFVF